MNIKLMPLLASSIIQRLTGKSEVSKAIELDDLILVPSEELTGLTSTTSGDFLLGTLKERAEQNPPSKEASNLLQELAHFGLKDAKDVIEFLDSKGGESIRDRIIEEFVKKIDEENQIRQEIIEKDAHRHQMLAHLLLKWAHKKSEHFKKICEYALEQIEKILHHEKDIQKLLNDEDPIELTGLLEISEKLVKEVTEELNGKLAEKNKLEEEFSKIADYEKTIERRYDAFQHGLSEVDDKQFKLDSADPASKDAVKDNITRRIKNIKNELKDQTKEIDQLIVDGKDKEAMQLMHEHNKRHLQVASLKDMLAVYSSEKKLFDKNGHETDSLEEAEFILKHDRNNPQNNQKIIKHNDTYYLVDSHIDSVQNLEPHKQKEAADSFNKRKPELLMVNKLVFENEKAEKAFHKQRHNSAVGRSQSLDQEITHLGNQLKQLQATKASIQAELRKPTHDLRKAQIMEHSGPTISSKSTVQLQSFLARALDRDIRAERAGELQNQQINAPSTTPTLF